MTRQEVIAAFCSLAMDVGEQHGHKHATDCVCRGSRTEFQFDRETMDFIIRAVHTQLMECPD